MKSPFPNAVQAYAESIHSETASRHHPDARLTILPLPSLAALYPIDDTHLASSSSSNSSASSPNSSAELSYRGHSQLPYSNQHQQHARQQPAYQSYDGRYQKTPASASHPTPSPSPASPDLTNAKVESDTPARSNKHEYMGTNMESLLNAVEVHSSLLASSSPSSSSLSPSTSSCSLSSAPSSPSADDFATDVAASSAATTISILSAGDSHTKNTRTNRRMSISNLVDDLETQPQREGADPEPMLEENNYRTRPKPMLPRPCSPSLGSNYVTHKRKWARLSTHTSEDPNRSPKIRRAIPGLVDGVESEAIRSFNMSLVAEGLLEAAPQSHASVAIDSNSKSRNINGIHAGGRGATIISCYHASVAQKSYGSEKRFLCPPPIVQVQGQLDDQSSGMTSKPQVSMSIICESGESSSVGQRSTLEEDQSSTFRYLYVSGTAKAKSFQLKLQVYSHACLPNGYVPSDHSQSEGSTQVDSDLPEPIAELESQPIAIISKPSKKTAKARNVSSCILAGSLVSLFNRINSQTVRTKYMSVQDGELCAKSSTWSSFTISIVTNGPSCPAPGRNGSSKSHHRQPVQQNATPITYGSEIILTETATGLQSDRLVVCKVENGRILQGAIGPICQMQKVALQSIERTNMDGLPVYLGAVGDDHQSGRFMDHSASSSTVLRYEPSTMDENSKAGGDDFLCWTIVGISKFEYAVDLP
ncbi:hypothetical protein EDD21DRAFT_377784 [Dissophora ornata]|nr:hypothetical protein EDD21DRAFT_377784 [Dissophora ornata]